MKKQKLYIYIDDSGKMSDKEICFSYGGVYFNNIIDRDNFKRLYTTFIKENKKTGFLKNNMNEEDEIKSSNSTTLFKRRVINLISNKIGVNTHSITIFNKNLEKYVFKNRHTKGRREDYYQKILIKKIILNEIKNKNIDPFEEITLIVNIDNSKRATNGIYNLRESLSEELEHGINNFNYGAYFPPIINGKLIIQVNYINSEDNILVQASDFIVGYVNKKQQSMDEKYIKSGKQIDVQIIL